MNAVSGWCTSPAGAMPKHEGCRAAVCSCPCGHKGREPMVDSESASQVVDLEAGMWDDVTTTKAAPGGATNTVIQGPRRSIKGTD